MAQDTVRVIYNSASGALSESERAAIARHAVKTDTRVQIENMLWFAARQETICTYAKDYDANPWLLNCLNGTIDLKTGKLLPHDRNHLITKICPVEYDPEANQKPWLDFLDVACQGDGNLMGFLQTAVGYSLTGDTGEEKLFFIHGPTSSGKSTFLEAIKATLGDYAQTADFETFIKQHGSSVRNDIAQLAGARFVVSIEVDEGKRLAEGLVKMLTGGDTVRARFLYQESFEFVPQCTLWLAANHAPRIKDTDAAMWRRILRVPFEYTIPDNERDPRVKANLRNPAKSGAAILAWGVKGCLKWQSKGLQVPDTVKAATEAYRQSQDPLKDFFEDRCEFHPQAIVPVPDLRAEYEEYAKSVGIRYTLGSQEFNERLRVRGCEDKSKWFNGRNQKCWFGVGLQTLGIKEPNHS